MIAQVALPLPIDKLFSYAVPQLLAPFARPLMRVKVPFHNRSAVGYIIDLEDGDAGGLKSIQTLVDCVPLIDGACFELCKWASLYYAVPIGLVLKYALSSTISIEKYCVLRATDPALAHLDGLTLKKACTQTSRLRILEYLAGSQVELADPFTGGKVAGRTSPGLQATGAARPTLFTGCVEERLNLYTSLIAEELGRGRSVLMLLPDYRAAGAYFYRSRWEASPAPFSGTAALRQASVRQRATSGRGRERARLILGNKSCVFLPVAANGLIIVERPEEDEYRNEEAFRFNAVRLALKRAQIEGVRCVIGSAAPPVEIARWASDGTFEAREGKPLDAPGIACSIGGDRDGEAPLPGEIVRSIEETLAQGGKVAVHVPRRSYASGLSCAACGMQIACPGCGAAALSYQRQTESLLCGACKGSFPYEERCPYCGSDLIKFFEIGAEYLEARIREAFPAATVARVTGEADKPAGGRERPGDAGIIVGTNILSKLYGLDTALLILYGWEDFLKIGGYRAMERMFHLLFEPPGCPAPGQAPFPYAERRLRPCLFSHSHRFYKDELEKRRAAEFPPFIRFFAVNILKRNKEAGERVIRAVERLAQEAGLADQMLGPIQVKGEYGWKVIFKGDGEALSPLLSSLYRLPGVHIEADPLSV